MICVNDNSESFKAQLAIVCARSPFGAYIESYFDAYSEKRYPFVEFWLQKENDTVRAAFCRYYDTVIFCGENSIEAERFVEMLSPQAVLCSERSLLRLDGFERSTGEVMRLEGYCNIRQALPYGFSVTTLSGEMRPLRQVFQILCETSSDMSGGFDDYFIDMSHKIRHETAKVYAVCSGGEIVSTLAVSALSKTAAVISSIATKSEYRRQGLAGAALSHASNELQKCGREVFLFRRESIPLYEKCGFAVCGRWAENIAR